MSRGDLRIDERGGCTTDKGLVKTTGLQLLHQVRISRFHSPHQHQEKRIFQVLQQVTVLLIICLQDTMSQMYIALMYQVMCHIIMVCLAVIATLMYVDLLVRRDKPGEKNRTRNTTHPPTPLPRGQRGADTTTNVARTRRHFLPRQRGQCNCTQTLI